MAQPRVAHHATSHQECKYKWNKQWVQIYQNNQTVQTCTPAPVRQLPQFQQSHDPTFSNSHFLTYQFSRQCTLQSYKSMARVLTLYRPPTGAPISAPVSLSPANEFLLIYMLTSSFSSLHVSPLTSSEILNPRLISVLSLVLTNE
jgi:hypothetical protein